MLPRVRPIFMQLSRQLTAGLAAAEEAQFKTFLRRSLANVLGDARVTPTDYEDKPPQDAL